MSTFYRLTHNSSYNRMFTWAASIHPRSDTYERTCKVCGVRESYPVGAFDVTVEGGSRYPDVLGCGAYPFLIVSETIIGDWREANITSFHVYPVGISNVLTKRLRDIPPPQYYRVELDGVCQIDSKASGLRVVNQCPECHHLWTDPISASGFQMVPDSWDGSALFRDSTLYPRVSFCTELILELARKHRRTNFRFEPMEGPFDSSSKGINYLGGQT